MRHRNKENEKEKRMKGFDRVLGLLHIFFIGFAVLLAIYLFIVQVIDVGKYRAKARNQRINRSFVMRGDIYDRNGIKLATDKVYSDVYAHPDNYDSSPEDLAKKLELLITNPNLRESLGQQAKFTMKNFSPDCVWAQWDKLLESVSGKYNKTII